MLNFNVMKRFSFIFISILFFSASCSKLDLVPISQKSTGGFYQTETHINQAVIGTYNALRSAWVTSQGSYMLTEARSDNTFQGQAYNDGPISMFQVTPDLPILNTVWTSYYNYIQRCNEILQVLDGIEMTAEARRQYEGEARFMRGLFYFDLVRFFGAVPVVTQPVSIDDSYKLERSTIEQVYAQIESDLTVAVEYLPSNYPAQNVGRATTWAARGYLGKVYMFMSGYPLKANRWSEAGMRFKEVIDSGNFEFLADYEANYAHENEGGKQQVFSIKFVAGQSGNGNPFPTRNASNDVAPISFEEGGVPFGGSPFNLFLSNDIVEAYEPGDIRKDVSILSSWRHKSGEIITSLPTAKKYQNGPVVQGNDWDIDWIALSYTDILMMYAEALNEIGYQANGEAYTIMNNVRTRAGLAPKTNAEVSDQNSFRDWVEKERRVEFAFENLRWFDLVRTDRALDVMSAFLAEYGLGGNVKSRDQYIYPIPQAVLNMTPHLGQNPGY